MGNAVWLFFALPNWYFSSILESPWSGGSLVVIPILGIISLIIGGVWGAVARRQELLIFLVLPAASQILVVVAGFMRGWIRDPSLVGSILTVFMLLQIAGAGYLVFRSKGVRLAAAALAIFTSSYAAFASFIAMMAFRGAWL